MLMQSDSRAIVRSHYRNLFIGLRIKATPLIDIHSYYRLDTVKINHDASGFLLILAKYKGVNGKFAKFMLIHMGANLCLIQFY